MKLKSLIVTAVAVVMLTMAGTALAAKGGGSLVAVYGGTAGHSNTQVKATPTHAAATAVSAKSTLPFTGFDVGIAIAGGLIFVLVGATLRRTTRQSS